MKCLRPYRQAQIQMHRPTQGVFGCLILNHRILISFGRQDLGRLDMGLNPLKPLGQRPAFSNM